MKPGEWVFEAHAPVAFGELKQPMLLEVIPSATYSHNEVRSVGAWQQALSQGDLGASVKYGITSTMTLDATVNPDFSQVESDAFEVEINQRFPVFFSEKRPFFMEGLGLFNLAGTGGDATMRTAVHTRRIVDPSAGIKLTGTSYFRQRLVMASCVRQKMGVKGVCFGVNRVKLQCFFIIFLRRVPVPVIPKVTKCQSRPAVGQARVHFDRLLSGRPRLEHHFGRRGLICQYHRSICIRQL